MKTATEQFKSKKKEIFAEKKHRSGRSDVLESGEPLSFHKYIFSMALETLPYRRIIE